MSSELEKTVQRLADIEDIKQLKARYASACDDNYNPDTLAPLFAEDAVWDGSTMGFAKGREGIREFFAAASALVPFAVHQISNPLIEIDGDTATGEWFLWQPMVFQGQALWMSAVYHDKYVRQDGKWLYQHLKLNIRMLTPFEEGPAKTLIVEIGA
jgi:uncharacterized protein (TIGR02246 family)